MDKSSIKKSKIIYISFDGMTDPLGQSQVIPYLIGLLNSNREIILLSCEKREAYAIHNSEIKQLLLKNNIHWYPISYHNRIPVLSTLYTIFNLFRKSSFLYKKYQFDLFHCRSYIPSLVGLHFKIKYNCKFIFDMRGFWPDEKIEGGSWNTKNPLFKAIYNYFKKKEIAFFNLADHTISLTEAGKKEIHQWSKINNQPIPITVIPCCADLSLFDYSKIDTIKKAQLKNELNIKDGAFVLHYLGSLGGSYLLKEMMSVYKIILEKKPDAIFLINTLTDKSYIEKIASELNINSQNIITKPAKRSELALYLSICNLAIYFIKPTFSKIASSPTKQAEILGMGIPIITNKKIGDSDTILATDNIGCLVNSFAEPELREAVLKIDNLMQTPKESIRKIGIDYYSLESGINKYNNVYTSLSV